MQGKPHRAVWDAQKRLLLVGLPETSAHGFFMERQFPNITEEENLVVRLARERTKVIKTGGSFNGAFIMTQDGFRQADEQINGDGREHEAIDVLPNISGEGDQFVERAPKAVKHRRAAPAGLLSGIDSCCKN